MCGTGFVRVMENPESRGILWFPFPGLESHRILVWVIESHENDVDCTK